MKDNWVTTMLELYGEGRSDVEVRKALGVSKRQWESYLVRSLEFRELVEHGHDLAEAWHFEKSRDMVTNPEYSTTNLNALSKRMENMYGWSTKVDSRTVSASLNLDARKELEERLPEILNHLGYDGAAKVLLEHKKEESSDE